MFQKGKWLILALCLAATLCACAHKDPSPEGGGTEGWTFPEGPAPETEYERVFWYGFAAEDAARDPSAAITEKEMADLLTAVITAAGGDGEGWKELTAGASGEEICRDYGAMLLLYAAERMDATDFTDGFAPYLVGGRTDEDWEAFGTDIRGATPSLRRGSTGGTAPACPSRNRWGTARS